MAKNQNPKKENPLLMGILAIVLGIAMFFFRNSNDLMLFHFIRLDGKIAFPIFGVFLILGGIFFLVEFFKKKKK